MSSKKADENKKIITVRVKPNLYQDIERIAADMSSNRSRISENYLKMSEIMKIKEDSTKIGWDNMPLAVYPGWFMQEMMIIMTNDLNTDNRFEKLCELGDKMGDYLNDIFSIKSIGKKDFKSKLEIIKKLGWFNYVKKNLY